MFRRILLISSLVSWSALAWADKIIMRDGKIYQGHIMGETSRSVMISNPPIDPKPRFIDMKEVMTIVRESRPAEKPTFEDGRYASVNAGLIGQVYSSDVFSFSPAAGLSIGGAFRIHPAVEVGGDFIYTPEMKGTLHVVAGSNTRSYEEFYSYQGGFTIKGFPFYKRTDWRAEPYLFVGYHWNRLVPKGSEDQLKGSTILGGAGVMIAWWKPLYWDFRFGYGHTNYSSIKFLTGDGDLSGVTHDTYTLSAGLSYRFL